MPDITIEETWRRAGGESQLIDVREEVEVADGMIPGARHICLGTLLARLSEIDQARPVIVICRSGNRSGRATDLLVAAGFRAENMAGGMLAWTAAGLPLAK